MELVSLMYKYINRFINSEELLRDLAKLDLASYPLEEQHKIKDLIKDIHQIKDNTPNEYDEYLKKREESIDYFLELFSDIQNFKASEENKEWLEQRRNKFLEDKKKKLDGGALYQSITNLLTNHELVCKYALSMDDYELLKFITEYISVPFPPVLKQEEFDELVQVGIAKDEREALWRLAFNYNRKDKDFTLIEDYFILKRDAYYLTELISAVEEDLDIETLIAKVMNTRDKEFISAFVKKGYQIHIFAADLVREIIRRGVQEGLLEEGEAKELNERLDKCEQE